MARKGVRKWIGLLIAALVISTSHTGVRADTPVPKFSKREAFAAKPFLCQSVAKKRIAWKVFYEPLDLPGLPPTYARYVVFYKDHEEEPFLVVEFSGKDVQVRQWMFGKEVKVRLTKELVCKIVLDDALGT